jgi:triacylglycerol esterase/lipase EstA (alpha/beta hydrolase family)
MKKTLLFLLLLNNTISRAQEETRQINPIIFIHGFLASGDTWTNMVQRFRDAGYNRPHYLKVLDWNSVSGSRVLVQKQLDSMVNEAIKMTGKKPHLVGHSAGGGICYAYLQDSAQAAKVQSYAHVGSMRLKKPALVPTLNLYSLGDKISGGTNVDGCTNISLFNLDHYQIATSNQSFEAMLTFFSGQPYEHIPSVVAEQLTIMGKACSLGENSPDAAAQITIYEWNNHPSVQLATKPLYTTVAKSDGSWGPFTATIGKYYQMVVTPTNGKSVHYFRGPITQTNTLVYLRTLSNAGMGAMLVRNLPTDSTQAVLGIFTANQAVVAGRDSLAANQLVLSTPQLTPAAKTAIAQFLYDDGDGKTSGQKLPAFAMLPFMNGVDAYLPVGKTIQLYWQGKNFYLPALASNKNIMVLVLE